MIRADVRAMGGQKTVYAFCDSLHGYGQGGAVDFRAAAAASFAGGGAVSLNPNVTATIGGPLELGDSSIARLGDYMLAAAGSVATTAVGNYDYKQRVESLYGSRG